MKHFLSLLFLAIFIVGCQERLNPQKNDAIQDIHSEVTRASFVSDTEQPNTRVIFLAEKDYSAWTQIVGLENRLKACDVSKEIVKSMTTEELVETILHYPLNYLVFTYNNPEDAVRIIIENSTLHQELLCRENAAECIVNKYLQIRPVGSVRKPNYEEGVVLIEDDMFLGYIIETEQLIEQMKRDSLIINMQDLEDKINDIINNHASFSMLLLKPLSSICESIGDNTTLLLRSGGVFLGFQQIHTPFLHNLDGMLISEYSSDAIEYLNGVAISEFPNAVFIENASAKYNCHSYAWYQNTTNNNIWLHRYSPITGNFQLSRYWTDDLYESCSSSDAEKVYYSDGDHSAIVLSNGHYLSKWGDGPLMEHAYNDCPYLVMNIQFYKEKNLPVHNDPVILSGPSFVAPNIAYTYTIVSSSNTVHYYLTAEGLSPSFTCSLTQIGLNTYSFTAYDYGAYRLNVRGYAGLNDAYLYSSKDMLVTCVGNL